MEAGKNQGKTFLRLIFINTPKTTPIAFLTVNRSFWSFGPIQGIKVLDYDDNDEREKQLLFGPVVGLDIMFVVVVVVV